MEKQTRNAAVYRFRITGLIEGSSFLLLLFIAMPVKYFLGIPELVKYVGWAHGVLFIAYCIFLLDASLQKSWKIKDVALYFVASLIPFGPFLIDKRLKQEE